jgi:phage pi2 protein 07
MVENFIQKHDGEFKKKSLWEHLPKKMMYQTYSLIIDYLLHSRKISIDSKGKYGWIYYPNSKHTNTKLNWKRKS